MPSRAYTAQWAIRSILRQVDVLYLYLDGFDEVPKFARQPNIEILRSQEFPGLHANGKLLGLHLDQQATHFVTCDDDYWYPSNFVRRLTEELHDLKGGAVVGVHGSKLKSPFYSYTQSRKVFTAWKGLDQTRNVDVVATCGTMHLTQDLRFDVRDWLATNQVDLHFAQEMLARGIEGHVIKRPLFWLKPLGMNQPDSIFTKLRRDDSRQTQLAKQLFNL